MELSTEEPESGINLTTTLPHHSMVQPIEVAASASTSDYNSVLSDCYESYDENGETDMPILGPLSMPLFPGQFVSSKRGETMNVDAGVSFAEDHFNYDEQLAETMEDSDAESFGFSMDSETASGTSSLGLMHLANAYSIYDGHYAPRRSSRERRLPAPFEMPLPRDSVTNIPRKPGRPPKNQPVRGRGRPRKNVPTTDPNTSIPTYNPSSLPKPHSTVIGAGPIPILPHTSGENGSSNFQPLGSTSRPLPSSPLATFSPSVASSSTTTHVPRNDSHHAYPKTSTDPATSPPRKRMLSARALSSLSTSPPEKMSHRAVTTYPSGKGNYSMLDGDTPVKSVFPVLKHLTGPAKTFFVADRPATNTRTEVSQSGFSNNHHINSSNTPFSALKYFMQPSQLLECKSGVMCMALSPCGMMLACGTLLGQILLFAAEQTGPMPMGAAMPLEEEISLEWNQVKWLKISVLQDFSETVVDRFWNIIWAPDSSAIVAAGSCNSRHQYDPEDADMKVIPCPLVVFDLRAFSASSTSSRESLVTEPKQAIRRFEGHFEEVVDMKIWRLSPSSLPDAASGAEYMLITCSQDGHVRRWKFDQEWKHLESVLMKDEETWMAFSSVHIRLPEPLLPADATHFSGKVLDAPLIRDSNEEGVLSKESGPKIIQPTSLFLLAGDMALKLFDGATAAKLWTSQELYETYCTNVEVFRTQSSIQHPFRPNTFLNGDGYVYGDSECKHILNEEPPTFLILTKGIDFIAPDLKRDSSKKPNGASEDSDLDKELDDEYGHRRKSAPSRIVLHALRIPLTCTKAMAPSSRNGVRRTEQTVRYTVNAELIKLEPLFDYSHPLFASNYWPSRMTHNGIHVLSAAASGTIFAWNLLKSSSDANLRVHSSSNEPNAGVRKPLNCHSHISSILASHDEDLPVRDVLFHPFWPFLFSAADDGSVHVWAPTLYDPIKSCAIPTLQGVSEPPVGACLSSVIVPRGSSAALSHHIAINHPNGPIQPGLHNLQAGSVYKSAIEAAMLATVGTVMPAAVKRKRGRPHKQKLIEEIEAQFAAQEKALQAQEQLLIIDPAQAPEPNPVQSAPIQATPTYNEYNFHYDPQSNPTHLQLP